ncbi:LysR substrate-binding domain-containing protein [Govanella unica]|uniref:LysR substrate-binding domain-containing protein n=1 Tax=Govanella unica TaxID=2975056 RepID=A0A9X3TYE4_9PROT|nr:LysR substrate-binding domain-containing protein [Govania unica]MDA5194240.1 LysR substrate-binding domain-containing protein [Govania unica]
MRDLPSIQTLRAFEAAARHENYSMAGDELGVTHSAVSHRIRELEERLEIKLFHRIGHRMTLTREAVTLLAQVRQALVILRMAFPDAPEQSQATLVVSVHPALATKWLIPRLGAFTKLFGNTVLEIRSTAELQDFLAPGIDVSIRYGVGAWPNAAGERMTGDVLFPVCSPAYRDQHNLQQPSDLARCRLLRHAWQQWSPWLRAANLTLREPNGGMTLSDTAMLLEAAVAGEGVALAGKIFASADLKSGRLVRLFDVEIEDAYAYYVVWRAGTSLTPLGEAFRLWVRDQFAI